MPRFRDSWLCFKLCYDPFDSARPAVVGSRPIERGDRWQTKVHSVSVFSAVERQTTPPPVPGDTLHQLLQYHWIYQYLVFTCHQHQSLIFEVIKLNFVFILGLTAHRRVICILVHSFLEMRMFRVMSGFSL